MKRSSFFKSLVTLIAAPSILAKIEIRDAPIKSIPVNSSLFKDLQLLTPSYYKQYVEKYGNEDYKWWLSEMGKLELVQSDEVLWYDSKSHSAVSKPIGVIPSIKRFRMKHVIGKIIVRVNHEGKNSNQ